MQSRPDRKTGDRLVIVETHPIQYRAPVYRTLHQKYKIPLTVIYGSDFSVTGYFDKEFRSSFAWDTDLLSGYENLFLSKVSAGGAREYHSVSARGLRQVLSDLRPGAILLPGYSPRFHQYAWWYAWRSRRPILFRGETSDRPQTTSALQLAARGRFLRFFYATCSKLLYIGARSRAHYEACGCSPEKLVFSPYCVDPASFSSNEQSRPALRAAMRNELGIAPDELVILFSGKLSERKGPDLLLESVRRLPDALRQKATVLFLGAGEMAGVLEQAASNHPRVKAHFAGFQNQKKLSPYFHAADLLVLPSRRGETWGLVVNEALHHGLPCVVSDSVGCGPDLIDAGMTGQIFTSGCIDSLADALKRCANLGGQPEVREACRRIVAEYSVDNAARGIAEAYAQVA